MKEREGIFLDQSNYRSKAFQDRTPAIDSSLNPLTSFLSLHPKKAQIIGANNDIGRRYCGFSLCVYNPMEEFPDDNAEDYMFEGRSNHCPERGDKAKELNAELFEGE